MFAITSTMQLLAILFAILQVRMTLSKPNTENETGPKSSIPNNIKLNTGASYPVLGFVPPFNPSVSEQLIEKALELGYRRIDAYPIVERHTGNVLNKWISSGKIKREDVFVSTQLFVIGAKADDIPKQINNSLDKLQLQYVDLYIISPTWTSSLLLGMWKELEAQVAAGRIKAIGVTAFNESDIQSIKKAGHSLPAVSHVRIDAYTQYKSYVNFLKSRNIAITTRTALQPTGAYYRREEDLEKAIDKIAKDHNKSVEEILIRFLTQQTITVSIDKETVNESDLVKYIETFDFDLTEKEMELLKSLAPKDE